MIVISLVASLVLLVVAVCIVQKSNYPAPKVMLTCFGFTVLPMCMMMVLPVVFFQSVLLSLALGVLAIPSRGRKLYTPIAILATVIAWCIVMGMAARDYGEVVALREKYAVQPLEERLPFTPASSASPVDSSRLTQLESDPSLHNYRSEALRSLHQDRVRWFVSSPGFGVTRMIRPGEWSLRGRFEDYGPVSQPEPRSQTPSSYTDSLNGTPDLNRPGMTQLHQGAVVDFANPEGFGWFKDRKNVAGFLAHGMTQVPVSRDGWRVAHLDLVGLVVHPEPVAYASEKLPRMDELRAAPTRPINPFEAEGLDALRRGEELYFRATEDGSRMLGAIRNVKQCVDCHGGNRGDLLGAFSYTLRRE